MPLSDEDFNRLLQKRLAGTEAAESEEDLDSLSEQDESDLAIMREALGNYKAESLAWAEKQSAAMPAPRPNAAAALWDRVPGWALAGTALATCGVAAAAFAHTFRPVATEIAKAPTAQAIAADNQLLSSVDDALAGGSFTLMPQELGLTSTSLGGDVHGTQRHGGSRSATN